MSWDEGDWVFVVDLIFFGIVILMALELYSRG